MLKTQADVLKAAKKLTGCPSLKVLESGESSDEYIIVGISPTGDPNNAMITLTFRRYTDQEGFAFGGCSGLSGSIWKEMCLLHQQPRS